MILHVLTQVFLAMDIYHDAALLEALGLAYFNRMRF